MTIKESELKHKFYLINASIKLEQMEKANYTDSFLVDFCKRVLKKQKNNGKREKK